MTRVSELLPDFPWDALRPYHARAAQHPDGIVDLSMGTPTDSTPTVISDALAVARNAPGYPLTAGTPRLRQAIVDYLTERCGAAGLSTDAVFPTIGSKEFVASAPRLLGCGADDLVAIPQLAYPTYEVGARLVGARVVRADSVTALGPAVPRLIWINSPANPTGQVLPTAHLRKIVDWARERGTLVISDECYLELGWTSDPVSILDSKVCGPSHQGILAVHSLSKRSNLGGYRAGFVAGDPTVVSELLQVRKHAGCIVPQPVQAAMVAALGDKNHVEAQRARYAARRVALHTALISAGFQVDHSEAGLYLWAHREENCWDSVAWFAERGVVVCPGSFYGPAGNSHIRVALTGSDERIAAAAARLLH